MSFKEFVSKTWLKIKAGLAKFVVFMKTDSVAANDPMIGVKKFIRYLIWTALFTGVSFLVGLIPTVPDASWWITALTGLGISIGTSLKKLIQKYIPEPPKPEEIIG